MRTVVVTGAAGSLGQRVVRGLAARDDVARVVALDVVPSSATDEKVDHRVVDLARPPGPADAESDRLLDGADSVIHLAWRIPDGKRPAADDAAETNRRALLRVLAALDTGRPATVVFLSSATVYGAWADNQVPLTEDAPLRPNPEFPFAVGKAEAERLLATWSDDHEAVRVVVLRPSVTVGSPERPLYLALGGVHSPRPNDDGARPVQFLHVDDLAAAVLHAWAEPLAGVYNVAPDAGIREDTARALAGGVAKVPLPDRLARAVAAWSWELWRTGTPKEAQPYASHPWVVAADKLKATGWQPRFSSEEALVATDPRTHWDDLPPGRRHGYTLILAVTAAGGVAAGVGSGIAAWRRHRRAAG